MRSTVLSEWFSKSNASTNPTTSRSASTPPRRRFVIKPLAAYKATRKDTDESLVSQFPLSREAIAALNLAGFELDGYEADDLIAHFTRLGRQKGLDVVIVTGDKDALQLVGDGVKVLNESKDILYGPQEVKERWGVMPEQIPEIFSLMGDSSDNIPGVPGIGQKTAVKLIQEYGTLEKLLQAAPTIKGKTGALLMEHARVRSAKQIARQIGSAVCRSTWIGRNAASARPSRT